jgi:hypothetical protein
MVPLGNETLEIMVWPADDDAGHKSESAKKDKTDVRGAKHGDILVGKAGGVKKALAEII